LIELKLEKILNTIKSMLTESLRFNDTTHAYAVIAAKSNVAVIANESVLEGYGFSHELS
jgi:GTP-sensing pleiotropic transcriptional regulator CodY